MNTMTTKKITKDQRDAFSAIGKMGGRAVARKRGKAYMARLGKRGADARWKK